jgi:TrmH family RNA methyltransferase
VISSRANAKVKLARSLRSRKERRNSKLFIAEGLAVIGQAVEAGSPIEFLLVDPERCRGDFADLLLEKAASLAIPVHEVDPTVFESLSERQGPQGIIAVINQAPKKLELTQPGGLCLGMISPQDPGNVGTILRTLDALGGGTLVLLEGGVDAWHPTAVKASMGAVFSSAIVSSSLAEFSEWASAHNVSLYGSSARADQPLAGFKPKSPWALLLGSEQKGLSDEQLARCEEVLYIPMQGRVSSLNLSVAAGLLLYGLVS